jgi:hypothetical protein
MHPIAKVSIARLHPRKAVGSRPAFPAWIDSGHGPAFSCVVVPRVRDLLVLRLVAKRHADPARKGSHARGAA